MPQVGVPPKIGLGFSKDAEHVEKTLAGGGASVDRLLGRFQRRAFFTSSRTPS
jgi:hypothetical protein